QRRHQRPALESGFDGRAGHGVEVVVDPEPVEAQALRLARHLPHRLVLGRRRWEGDQVHLPALGDEDSEARGHGRQCRRAGPILSTRGAASWASCGRYTGVPMQLPTGLACPRCHGTLQVDGPGLRCPACAVGYPVADGIPSFLEPVGTMPSPSPCALSVVLPALNEAASLERMLPDLFSALRALDLAAEVIVIDGGSQDSTVEVARRHGARTILQEGPGYGGALRTGFGAARGDDILTLDADGYHDPTFLRDVWSARESAEVVIASRYVLGGRAEMPWTRLLLSRTLNLAFRRGLSLPARDLSSGFRLYARRAIARLDLAATDFDVLEEILIRALAEGYRVREIPFHYRARLSGRSHADLRKFALSYLRTFGRMWRLRNSIAAADYDARAYDSVVPLQRYWQRRRFKLITGF